MVEYVRTVLITACAALLIAGCEGISVTKAPLVDSTVAGEGVPWNLGMTQFTVTISRHATACGINMKAKVETLASASTVVDEQQRYLLASKGWFATSDITADYATSGLSTSLNTETTDQTAKVIGNVIGTAAQVVLAFAAAGGAAPGAVQPPPPKNQMCSDEVAAAVLELYPPDGTSLKKKVESATALLAQKNADVAMFTAQLAVAKDDAQLKAKLIKSIEDQEEARKDLQAKQDKFAANLNITTDIQTVTWPDQSTDFRMTKPFQLSGTVMRKWTVRSADSDKVLMPMNVYLALYRQAENGEWRTEPVLPKAEEGDQKTRNATSEPEGVPVRLARPGKLLMCIRSICPPALTAGTSLTDTQYEANFNVLQIGPTHWLPAEGGAFRSEAVAITLDTNGAPSKLRTQEKIAPAETISTAAKDAATQLAALPSALRQAELAKTTAEAAQINADVALQSAKATAGLQLKSNTLTAESSLIAAQLGNATAKNNAGIQGLQLEQASLGAQSSLLGARAALAVAEANAQVSDETSVLGAQTTLINAQTAQINAAASLVRAQQQTQP